MWKVALTKKKHFICFIINSTTVCTVPWTDDHQRFPRRLLLYRRKCSLLQLVLGGVSLFLTHFQLSISNWHQVLSLTHRHLCFGLQNIYFGQGPGIKPFCLSAAVTRSQIENENGGRGRERRRRRSSWLFPQFRWCSFDSTREKKYVHKVQVSVLLLYTFFIVYIRFYLFIVLPKLYFYLFF